MGSAVAAREALAGIPGVIRAHAFGHNGKALVFVSDKKALTEEKVGEALRLAPSTDPLALRKMEPAKI